MRLRLAFECGFSLIDECPKTGLQTSKTDGPVFTYHVRVNIDTLANALMLGSWQCRFGVKFGAPHPLHACDCSKTSDSFRLPTGKVLQTDNMRVGQNTLSSPLLFSVYCKRQRLSVCLYVCTLITREPMLRFKCSFF